MHVIPFLTNRVGGCNHGTSGLQGGDDAGLADADGLLLHGLVDGGAVTLGEIIVLFNISIVTIIYLKIIN